MRSLAAPQSSNLPVRRAFSFVRQWLSSHTLASLLLLAAAVGVACFVTIPPWWHYDEPGHFEYAWLAAHSPTWPVAGQYDQAMRKQMAKSMARYDWYRIRNYEPNFKSSEPIPIGVTQTGDQPGYYFLASLPLRMMPNADMTVQYYAARSVSLLLFLLIILAARYALGEILPGSPLRWIATAFIAVLPAFVDEMVSVNNDVAAVLAASLAIWACLRLIQKGYSLGRGLFLVASLAACYLSKSTALFAFSLAALALVLGLLRGRYALVLWAAAALVLLIVAATALTWGAPRSWYTPAGNAPARLEQQNAPLGIYAFRLDDSIPGASSQLMQIVSPGDLNSLKGQTATLGAWLWAAQPTQAGPFFVEFLTSSDAKVDSPQALLDVTPTPVFHQFTFDVPGDAVNATLYVGQSSHGLPGNSVFLDGLVLVPGGFPTGAPRFSDASGGQVTFGGRVLSNLVRNASAEVGSFQIRKSVDDKTAGLLGRAGISPNVTLALIQDWGGTGWYYRGAVDTMFRTFWTSLAGDTAFISSGFVNYFLVFLTMAGVLGALVRLWARRRSVRWDLVGFLAIALLLPWALALIRGSGDLLSGTALFPWARYAFPAILPTALLLCAGWLEWLERLKLLPVVRGAILFGVMLGIFLLAILNAVRIFHPGWWGNGVLPALFILCLAAIFYIYVRADARTEPQGTPS